MCMDNQKVTIGKIMGNSFTHALSKFLKFYYDEYHIFPILINIKRSLYKKKTAVYYFQISLFILEIFKFLKYAN